MASSHQLTQPDCRLSTLLNYIECFCCFLLIFKENYGSFNKEQIAWINSVKCLITAAKLVGPGPIRPTPGYATEKSTQTRVVGMITDEIHPYI